MTQWLGRIRCYPTRVVRNFGKIELGQSATYCSYSFKQPVRKSELLNIPNKDDDIFSKIIYNSVLAKFKTPPRILRKMRYLQCQNRLSDRARPAFLRYLNEEPKEEMSEESDCKQIEEDGPVNFPYKSYLDIKENIESKYDVNESEVSHVKCSDLGQFVESELKGLKMPDHNWMRNYDTYDETKEEDEYEMEFEQNEAEINYGTPDPTIPVSQVPCGGCGALLHCQDPAIPGYLPKQVYTHKERELRKLICQRCFFLKEYNTALGITISPEDYLRVLNQIRHRRALVILMIDLLDFPCSIWHGIFEYIGKGRPFFVVANKVDLLPQDDKRFEDNIKDCVTKCLEQAGFNTNRLLHTAFISAKTGYGVESLITKLQTKWGSRGDVYLVGCTNVGKSTLFNTLIMSDYCKVEVVDVVQRATTSLWPGTTLNTLKFPILRPSKMRLFQRTTRLISQRDSLHAMEQSNLARLQNSSFLQQTPLKGFVGRTFGRPHESPLLTSADPFGVNATALTMDKMIGLNPNDENYAESKWFYDTPGVIHPQQILDMLTTNELMLTLPKNLIVPRTYCLKQGYTLFIGGLSRLDYISGAPAVRYTVFASKNLPITITKTEDAEDVYSSLVGTEYFLVPMGNEKRMKKWPELKSKEFDIVGEFPKLSSADVVLSSSGWIAVNTTKGPDVTCKVRAWTPKGRGIYLREPPLLKRAVKLRGQRIKNTPLYATAVKVLE